MGLFGRWRSIISNGGGTGGSVPSNVILFEDWNGGESVTIDTSTSPPSDTSAPIITVSPNGGTFASSLNITLTANETSTIYYTLDGTTPTTSSTIYSNSFTITDTTTLKFFGKDSAGNASLIQSFTFTKDVSTPADTTAPVLTITPATTFADSQTVAMSTNETADIWYTTDGSDPVSSGTRLKYSSALTLTATTTVKAYAVDTAGNTSATQTVVYTRQASTPYVSDGLKVYYDYSSLTSTPATVTDLSGNANDGTLYGFAGTASSGINNGELVSDGTNDYIKFSHKSDLKTYPFTVEFYTRATPPSNQFSNSLMLFDSQYGTGTGNGVHAKLNRTDNTNTSTSLSLAGTTGQPATLTYSHTGNIFDNIYRHYVIVYGATSQKIYINGQLVASQTSASTNISASTRDFNLYMSGNDSNGATTVNGAHKLFRFYSKELSQAEVTQNYNDAIS